MNHNPQSSDGKHEDDSALSDFLASLKDYTPTIPDELVEHYLSKSDFQSPDVRLYGSWGVCFTYGTWFGVKGLVAAGKSFNNSSSIKKACDFLLSKPHMGAQVSMTSPGFVYELYAPRELIQFWKRDSRWWSVVVLTKS